MLLPLISFDAAGTLIQVREPVGKTYAQFASQHGIVVEEVALKQAFRRVWGGLNVPFWPEGQRSPDDDRSWWRGLVGEVFTLAADDAVPDSTLDPLFDELYAHFARPDAWIVFDDVLPALTDLSRDHRLCVLSNFDRRLRSVLSGHGLDSFFEHIILSSEVGASKPQPRMFDTALHLMNADAATSWHVGDDLRCDVQGAENSGWQAFAVDRPGRNLMHFVEKVRSQANSSLRTAL
ncbi:HAD-IA family hydrolase [Prosthecobacter sp. SYSU 5D2]|uniref:HAD-IA family hydrolase n=1 Tax=Prosthecobacter sp. SYSU 5D2 TaxID=3134134 RepID=UPI0031FF1A9F